MDPYSFSELERLIWKALEFSDEPERVFRKACLTGFEGIKALFALKERGLIDVESAAAPETNKVQRVREELVFLKRLAWGKAVLWAGVAAAVLLWIRKMFLSPAASEMFTGWVGFF